MHYTTTPRHTPTKKTDQGKNIWIKRSLNTLDDQIQQGTHDIPYRNSLKEAEKTERLESITHTDTSGKHLGEPSSSTQL